MELADELAVADDRKRGVEDEVFCRKNVVVFPFTEMGKTDEKTSFGKIEFHLDCARP